RMAGPSTSRGPPWRSALCAGDPDVFQLTMWLTAWLGPPRNNSFDLATPNLQFVLARLIDRSSSNDEAASSFFSHMSDPLLPKCPEDKSLNDRLAPPAAAVRPRAAYRGVPGRSRRRCALAR